jgi:hypothetical protein
MPRLDWNDVSLRSIETGVDRGVFFSNSGVAEVWNGIVAVSESPKDVRNSVRYLDGVAYPTVTQEVGYSSTVHAYTYPSALERPHLPFSFTYRTQTSNGYKIHLVYNAKGDVVSTDYNQKDASTFEVDITTKPMAVERSMPTAHLIVDSTQVLPQPLKWVEDTLYGTDTSPPRMPLPQEMILFFEEYEPMRVYDLGNDRFMIVGPSSRMEDLGSDRWALTSDKIQLYVKNGNNMVELADDV